MKIHMKNILTEKNMIRIFAVCGVSIVVLGTLSILKIIVVYLLLSGS